MTSAGDHHTPPDWWHQTPDEVLTRVRSAWETGLTDADAAQRLSEEGRNELVRRERDSLWRLAWAQIREPMMLLLLVAAGVSILIHEYTDAVAIFAIVLLSGALGFVQEYRAERAIAGLKRLAEPEVQVRRDTRIVVISGRDLVTGDIVLLEAGNRVAADCRVLESQRLQVQEAALTGESAAVEKFADVLPGRTPGLGDRRNMVYMGTEVAAGRAEAVVVETGMQTELGRIAELLQSVRPPCTPLQRRLARMSVWLSVVALGIVSIVFVTGLLRGQDLALMLMTAMSMAVAAVPEGLPAVATISMALGARRMLRRNALIRRPARGGNAGVRDRDLC